MKRAEKSCGCSHESPRKKGQMPKKSVKSNMRGKTKVTSTRSGAQLGGGGGKAGR